METSRRRPARAVAWMILAQFLFTLMAIGARFGGRGVPWPEVGAARFLLGGITAYAIGRARGQSLLVTRQREAWLRSAFGTLGAAGTFFVYAAPGLPLGDAVTLLSTSPIFVTLLSAPMLGERVGARSAMALALGFSGIVIIAQPSFTTAGPFVAAGTGAALASALAMMSLRRISQSESSEAIVLHLCGVGFAAMPLASVPVWQTPRASDLLALTLMGLSGGLAQIAMTRAYALDRAARVSIVSFSSVVIMRIVAVPIFGEIPSSVQVVGSLLVIASGILLGSTPLTALRGKLRT